MELWERVLGEVEKRISYQNFDIWFRPTTLMREEASAKKLWVRVPNKHFKYWLEENYREEIAASLEEAGRSGWEVVFVNQEGEEEGEQWKSSLKEPCQQAAESHLNPKYTFGSFVVGFSNQFAHAASAAVAEQPGKAYNPLFIYGGVGLGKTHLMHAMGHFIKRRWSAARLNYISSEHFMNELINAIRYDRTPQFREKYRNIDVLFMDDIQFLAGKERTQEEFFHTFNALYDGQKQIVITSDCPPREIPTLEERLHSRFEWGLIADIQPPDVETKIAILRKKAEFEQVDLPDEVAGFIATHAKSSIRELEGSLVRLSAYSSLTGERVTLELAERVLRNMTEAATRVVTVDRIQKVVAEHYSLTVTELKAKDNSRRVTEPRQLAMFLCRELTTNSLPEIGKQFGGKHHTTVLHSIRKIKNLRKSDPRVEGALATIVAAIR